jgi:hypothetical protein
MQKVSKCSHPGFLFSCLPPEVHTIEWQKLLMKAAAAGKKFSVMGGNHLTADDLFIATEMSLWEKEKQHLAVLKKKCE